MMKLFKKKISDDAPRRRTTANENVESLSMQSDTFRRNRTITGSTSNRFNSVGGQDSDLVSPRKHAHHLTIQRRKVFAILMSVLSIIIMLWFLISNFTAVPSVSFFDLTISKKIDSTRYEKVIQNYLDANPLSRFHFALNQESLLSYVSNKLPEVSGVQIRNSIGIGVTNFAITVRNPVAGWRLGDKQFYVDSNGISFEKNYYIEPSLQIVDNSGVSTKTGAPVASNRFLGFVGRVVSLSKASGYTVTEAILPPNTTRQLQIKLKEGGYLVKLSIDRPAGEQVEDMSRAVKHFASKGQTPQYIDVRVSGKAFYK